MNSNEITSIQVLGRAFRVLQAVALYSQGGQSAALRDVVCEVKLHTSTTCRILGDLVKVGAVIKTNRNEYRMGALISSLLSGAAEESRAPHEAL